MHASKSFVWEQYQIASTIFEFFEGWERATVDDDSGLVMIEGAGFSPARQYVCLYYDNAVIEVKFCCSVCLYGMCKCCIERCWCLLVFVQLLHTELKGEEHP